MVGAMGYCVYDCDSMAKVIMDGDDEIKKKIAACVHPEAITAGGRIDRKRLAEVVFADHEALSRLNEIVHTAVRSDLGQWKNSSKAAILFVETAILYQSGIDAMVDEVWEVSAPVDLRVERVMARNGLKQEEVMARIAAQDSFEVVGRHPATHIIINDGREALLPQVEKLLDVSNNK